MFQDADLAVSENLNNPNKSRVKGPSGRKLPTRKKIEEDENSQITVNNSSPFDATFKKKLSKCIIQKKASSPEREVDLNLVGSMNPAEFNKVWFFKVPTIHTIFKDSLVKNGTIALSAVTNEADNNNVIDIKEANDENTSNNSTEESLLDNNSDEKLKKAKLWKKCVIL